jgi:hypothetical protein
MTGGIIWILSKKKKILYKGCEEGCYLELQQRQHLSANRALAQGEYKIKPLEVTEAIEKRIMAKDKWTKVKLVLEEECTPGGRNKRVKVTTMEGKPAMANTYAMTYPEGAKKGDVVECLRGYVEMVDPVTEV